MKKLLKLMLTAFYILTVVVVWWIGYLRYSGNFYEIANGVYRSHQLYKFDFAKFYKKYHFKTILNLRGVSSQKWYKYEKAFCKKHNIVLINFGISDRKVQSVKLMKKLVNIMKKSKKPLLIHCKAGADRSGLASALYLYSTGDKNYSKMLSFKYGHFPYLGSKTKAMDISFKNWIFQAKEKRQISEKN